MVEEELLPPTAGDGRNLSATLRLDHGILEVYVSDLGFTRWHLLEFEELRQIIAGSFCGTLSGCVWDCPRTKLPMAALLTLLATHVEEAVGFCPASCYFDAPGLSAPHTILKPLLPPLIFLCQSASDRVSSLPVPYKRGPRHWDDGAIDDGPPRLPHHQMMVTITPDRTSAA